MSKGDTPPLPDFNNMIGLQSQANLRQFQAGLLGNRVNSITPYGSTTWTRPPGMQPPGRGAPISPGDGKTGAMPGTGSGGVHIMDDGNGNGPGDPGVGNGTGGVANGPAPGTNGDPTGIGVGNGGGPNGTGVPISMDLNSGIGGGGPSLPPFNPDEYGPWTVNQTLSPNQQALLTGQEQLGLGRQKVAGDMLSAIAGQYSTPFSAASMAPTFNSINGPTYDATSRNRAEQALYGRQTQYLDPQFDRAGNDLEQKLLAEGFNRGDPGFTRAMDEFNLNKQRAYSDARMQAIAGGGTEASGELSRGLQAAQFGQSERDAALNNAYKNIGLAIGDRQRPLDELAALSGGSGPSPLQPPISSTGAGAPGGMDIMGAFQQQYGNQLGASNASNAASSNFWGGLLSAAVSTAPYWSALSDRRLKTDINHVYTDRKGTKWYTWTWRDSKRGGFGVMADEVPWAAHEGADGYLRVDYLKV